jgi:hypothetical protein
MAKAGEVSITLPAEVVERARALSKDAQCSLSQLLEEALHRYEAFDRLQSAVASGEDRMAALDRLLEDYVDRVIHEYRAERRAEIRDEKEGERKVS